MDYCKKCKNFGCNAAGTERTTMDCEDYMSHLPTNADRIRAMTDEELAKFIEQMEVQGYDLHGTFGADYWLDWLKQEAIT